MGTQWTILCVRGGESNTFNTNTHIFNRYYLISAKIHYNFDQHAYCIWYYLCIYVSDSVAFIYLYELYINEKKVHTGLANCGVDFILFSLRIFSNPYVCAVDSVHGVAGLNIFSYVM